MREYYTKEACDELINSIYYAEDTIKYLLNLPEGHEDLKLRTPELMEALSDVSAACTELAAAFNYYMARLEK